MQTHQTASRILPLRNVSIEDEFWSEYIRLVRHVVVPYQWEALNDRIPEAERSHAVRNFKIAAGEEEGEYGGMVFQDSDVAKWLEAVGYLLQTEPDPELEQVADAMIDIIAKAQHPDGYLNTYFTLKEPGNRWSNLAECHELYCAGHMIEAAVAYYEATGKRKILDVACKLADCIDSVFGPEPGKIKGYDGHQEIELALVKLYRTTDNERYLKLSEYFLNERGAEPHFYHEEFRRRTGKAHFPQLNMAHDLAYSQAHKPVREQDTAEGHAVRLVYMLTAMADVAAETGDRELVEACRRLWKNIVARRMYITGGIGSMAEGESFTADYDLPSDTAYAETCASIGLIFFAQRMLRIAPESHYADVMEKALYNTVVGGMSRDGKRFFYVNPLELAPDVCGVNHIYDHVKPTRQGWFGCACCPPNIARLLASLGQYIYTVKDRIVYTHLYVGSKAEIELGGEAVALSLKARDASSGHYRMEVTTARPTAFVAAFRVPEWTDRVSVTINGVPYPDHSWIVENGYIHVPRRWTSGDRVELIFSMPIRRMKGHPAIRHTASRVAIQRGPFIYCAEEADNGPNLHQLVLPRDSELELADRAAFAGNLPMIQAAAVRLRADDWSEDALYRDVRETAWVERETTIKLIPYFAWANRERGEMRVWINEGFGQRG
ncbi:glycoside hydrolase family 127 protein [Paenibacillaceae bacterium WGS1546]|uniref:glycoside hydrolase family 127 protein n=1 Tax=Cohnella sp. WGS1546 TaxID=3366810 RepID=UPI00372D2B4B